MTKIIKTIMLTILVLTASLSYSQSKLNNSIYKDLILAHINSVNDEITSSDLQNIIITSEFFSKKTKLTHLYLQQQFQGIKIDNAISSIAIKDNKVAYFSNRFIPNANKKIKSISPFINSKMAIEKASKHLKLNAINDLNLLESATNQYLYSKGTLSKENIPVELILVSNSNNDLTLSWKLKIKPLDGKHVWGVKVDAANGNIIVVNDYIQNCLLETGTLNSFKKFGTEKKNAIPEFHLFKHNSSLVVDGSKYNVFNLPTEAPIYGNRVLVDAPASILASPFGWHDTNGIAGAEHTITRGNNVYAQEDRDGDDGFGNAPDGGVNLEFDRVLDFSQDPLSYIEASTINAFYTTNTLHDIFYAYGFDEASGNFQEKNYSEEGLENDFVIVDVQDALLRNNASMELTADGVNPRLEVGIFTLNETFDGSFDNGLLAHEYGHGVTSRLGGGAANADCTDFKDESHTEGWSDWYAMVISMREGDLESDPRGIGNFVIGQSPDGGGIRTFPYVTDISINPLTYDSLKTASTKFDVGHVWGTILWDLSWAYVNKYGFDADLLNGNGGNNRVIQLVLDGLKLQPCGDGFVDSRDAILAADQILTGGENECMIWEVFARRGLGFNADQGSPDSITDGTESFDMPDSCALSVTYNSIEEFEVYPNPTSGDIIIKSITALNTIKVSIIDITGRVLVEKLTINNLTENKRSINISNFSSGTYFLSIENNGRKTIKQIIKE